MNPDAMHKPPTWVLVGTVVIGLLAAFLASHVVQQVFFLTFFAILLAILLHYPISFFARWMPRGIATMLTLVLILGSVFGFLRLTLPVVVEQGQLLLEQAPSAVDKAKRYLKRISKKSHIEDFAGDQPLEEAVQSQVQEEAAGAAKLALPIAISAVGAIGGALALLALSLFLAYAPEAYVGGIVRLIPTQHELTARELFNRMGSTLHGWLVGTLVSMVAVGVITAAGLLILGIPSWLVLGLVNFFAEFVPYIGPVLGALPGLAVGLSISASKELWVLGLYILVQQLENYAIQPLVMKRAIKIHPALLLVWQLLMGGLFGVFGVLAATPLLACIKVTVDYLYVEKTLGKSPLRAPG